MKNILFISGGWDGHQPENIVQIFKDALQSHGLKSEISTSLEILDHPEKLKSFDVIFLCWTMGSLTPEQTKNLIETIHSGVGLAGIHGGMGDAFRGNLDYEWMVGGHFVGHPYVGDYKVRIVNTTTPITQGIPSFFDYHSEQYYMMVDPSIQVLAETDYTFEDKTFTMPVAWIKSWGKGKVFYSALGHAPEEFSKHPLSLQLALQGILWAAKTLS
ncbi:MAG: ThuA domain-containing protein [Verrucomicrobiota bacterium]